MSEPQTNGGETASGTVLDTDGGSGRESEFYSDPELGISSRVRTGGVVVSVHAPADATALEIALALDRAEAVTARELPTPHPPEGDRA